MKNAKGMILGLIGGFVALSAALLPIIKKIRNNK